jgi:hypothetical protein
MLNEANSGPLGPFRGSSLEEMISQFEAIKMKSK